MQSYSALLLLALAASATAFAPMSGVGRARTIVSSTEAMPEDPPEPPKVTINGWSYDKNAFMGGLPGNVSPLGDFDPLGFSKGKTQSEVMRLREAEVMHGRVSMMAVIGYFAGEAIAPLTGNSFIIPEAITGPANVHLQQQGTLQFALFVFWIGITELTRAIIGWTKPADELFGIREDYYPGDIGFDPAGLKPTNAGEFKEMATKEIQNGRLAMIAIIGFWGQELVNGQGILENLF
jgi:hypothetical protein